jgi:hypothetical protein
VAVNDLGLTASEADSELARLEPLFALLPDSPSLLTEWRHLVVTHGVLGKNAHDARLVAAMRNHGMTQLLSFNVADFSRFPGITVIDPTTVSSHPAP